MSLKKIINLYLPFWDFLYILQLEEYHLFRYYKQVVLRLFKRNFEVRDSLKYTKRIIITLCLSLAITISLLISASSSGLLVGTLVILPFLVPFLILVSSLVISLPVYLAKKRQLRKARNYFEQTYPNTKIIAVTGSFGKTTTKYLLAHLLQYDFSVSLIPDNINTGLGIANLVLKDIVPRNTEYLIVEMGAHTRGDIKETAQLLPPDFALITTFGDQHMERFGSFANLVKAKSEIFTTNPKTKCFVSVKDMQKAREHGVNTDQLIDVEIESFYDLAKALVSNLGVSGQSIQKSIESFLPPSRRDNIIVRNGVTILDNSYNLSPTVATYLLNKAAVFANEQNKKLVVLTGGIGEQGKMNKQVNIHFANELNQKASRVLLAQTVYAEDIEKTLVIPVEKITSVLAITEQPEKCLNGDHEILLWLTEHSDLAYL